MTYDDWKTTDDTPAPDPNRCAVCGHPEGHCDCPCCVEPEWPPLASEKLKRDYRALRLILMRALRRTRT
jgi:hypothetical protein